MSDEHDNASPDERDEGDEPVAAAIRDLAAHLPVTTGDPPAVTPSRVRPVSVLAGALAAAAVMIAVIVVVRRDDHRQVGPPPVDTSATLSIDAPTTALSNTTTVETSSTSTTIATATTTTAAVTTSSTAPEGGVDGPLTMPVLNTAECTNTSARRYLDNGPFVLYAKPSSQPITVQIFASASGSITDPFVVVERFTADQPIVGTTNTDVNGQPASVGVGRTGGGGVQWLLADGTGAYVRGHGFDADQLVAIANVLEPRPADAPVPGFDLAAGAPGSLLLLDETHDPLVADSRVASACTVSSGFEVFTRLMYADTVTLFATYLDQPAPYPAARLIDGGRGLLAVIDRGALSDATAAIATVRDAAPQEWGRLLISPEQSDVDMVPLPTDQSVLDHFAGRTFATLDDVKADAIALIATTLSADEVEESTITATALTSNANLHPVVVVTRRNLDDSVIATVWMLDVAGSAPNLTVDAVTTGNRCRDGVLYAPTTCAGERETGAMSHIELVTIVVDEYDPAITFFVDVLGFELVEDSIASTNDGRPKRWVVFRPPNATTGILLARADGDEQSAVVGRQVAGRVGFFLRVDDFDAAIARMTSAGVEFVSEPRTEPYGRVAVFRDVAGNRWDLLGSVADSDIP